LEKRPFGKTGLEVSVLGFGGAVIGITQPPQAEVDRLLGAALDDGLNVIDTAECYDSEHLIGHAVAARRRECLLFTKCGHNRGLEALESWTPELLELSIERSLRRLRTDYLDLVQLHTCPLEVLRRGDCTAVLQRARDSGKTRFIGCSGDGEAALYAVECGAFDAVQVSVSIADQEAVTLILPPAARRGMGVIAKRPVANVVWAKRERPGWSEGEYWDRLGVLDYDFLRSGDTRAEVAAALRFTLGVVGVHTAIVGTSRLRHWRQNLATAEAGPLDGEEFERIRRRWQECARPDWTGQQ
jgi:aryl-alcohol dehydrogenase-like predicted oxidoreductase